MAVFLFSLLPNTLSTMGFGSWGGGRRESLPYIRKIENPSGPPSLFWNRRYKSRQACDYRHWKWDSDWRVRRGGNSSTSPKRHPPGSSGESISLPERNILAEHCFHRMRWLLPAPNSLNLSGSNPRPLGDSLTKIHLWAHSGKVMLSTVLDGRKVVW